MKLSDTQLVILSAAAKHELGLARTPKGLPAAARNAVFRSLIKNNLLTEINAQPDHVGLGWRQDADGTWIVARITDEGLRAIGIDPNAGDAVAGEPADPAHPHRRLCHRPDLGLVAPTPHRRMIAGGHHRRPCGPARSRPHATASLDSRALLAAWPGRSRQRLDP